MDLSKNSEILSQFLNYMETILNKSPNTIKEYNYDLNRFFKVLKISKNLTKETELNDIDVTDIDIKILETVTLDDIYSYLAYITKNFNSKPATRARKVACLKVFFSYLTKKNQLKVNPAQDLETPKIGKRMPKYLSLDESKQLLSNIKSEEENRNKERNYAMITLFLNCGMRLSELVGIDIKDINFSEAKLNVIGKGNKERTIYLNIACMSAIKNYLSIRKYDANNTKEPLFVSERNKQIGNRTVQYIVRNELLKSGLDIEKYSVHKLRHTAATLMYQYGNVDIRALQELLGHESISTTEIYTHVSNEQVRAAVEDNPLSNIK